CARGQPGRSAAAIRVEPDPRPADLIDRPERGAGVGDPRFPLVAVAPRERRVLERRLACESRLKGKSPRKSGEKRAAKRAAKSAATSVARPGKRAPIAWTCPVSSLPDLLPRPGLAGPDRRTPIPAAGRPGRPRA